MTAALGRYVAIVRPPTCVVGFCEHVLTLCGLCTQNQSHVIIAAVKREQVDIYRRVLDVDSQHHAIAIHSSAHGINE